MHERRQRRMGIHPAEDRLDDQERHEAVDDPLHEARQRPQEDLLAASSCQEVDRGRQQHHDEGADQARPIVAARPRHHAAQGLDQPVAQRERELRHGCRWTDPDGLHPETQEQDRAQHGGSGVDDQLKNGQHMDSLK